MKFDLLSFGNVIWQRFKNVSWLRTYDRDKVGTGSIPEGKNLSGEDSNCLVEHLQIA